MDKGHAMGGGKALRRSLDRLGGFVRRILDPADLDEFESRLDRFPSAETKDLACEWLELYRLSYELFGEGRSGQEARIRLHEKMLEAPKAIDPAVAEYLADQLQSQIDEIGILAS
ncbi:MAG: hypothetical protein MPN21_09275 [Thermoanaerobaculia bacterium]|nr:hypothetical protein [Thermoanaerobaculia bacterium]